MSCFSFFRRGGASSPVEILTDDAASEKTLVFQEREKDASQHALSERDSFRLASVPTGDRLAKLRERMSDEKSNFDWYVVLSEDEHASEYTAPPDRRREFISGFTGSAGVALIRRAVQDKMQGQAEQRAAHCFADGRYWVQAAEQLDGNWELHKIGAPGVDNWDAFLVASVEQGQRVGLDGRTIGYAAASDLAKRLKAKGVELVAEPENLVDSIWENRPAPKEDPVYEHRVEYAGKHANEKLADLHKWNQELLPTLRAASSSRLDEEEPAAPSKVTYLVSTLDEVAWLLNLRGSSVPNNPEFPAYVTVTSAKDAAKPEVALYISPFLVPSGSPVDAYLRSTVGLSILAPEQLWDTLRNAQPDTFLVGSESISHAAVTTFAPGPSHVKILGPQSPVAMAKAIKNKTEIEAMRRGYLRDGIAWAIWMAHLDHAIRRKGEKVSEWEAAQRLAEVRSKFPHYAGESYDAISATGPHAALPHYETPAEGSSIINTHTPYLMDAGAQYSDGCTIDTTRTVHFGRATQEQKRSFTRVLQGHIAIDRAIFPEGSTGATLDVLARAPLWQDGKNFSHGTGHGIGAFLGVHEGPQGFSTSSGGAKTPVPLRPGMMLSNEPGFYEEGSYGIRTESIIFVKEVQTRRNFGGAKWFGFERITQVPIDRSLVDFKLLSSDEWQWLRDHNESVKKAVLPHLKHDRLAQRWLKSQ